MREAHNFTIGGRGKGEGEGKGREGKEVELDLTPIAMSRGSGSETRCSHTLSLLTYISEVLTCPSSSCRRVAVLKRA